ncbi:hypothetical protein ACGFYV_07510 [Streptomyces sp. NPDC048297]|uniref:hypothetical protein n=1 Tax=Streptomyces sp. NPDC048297 TaxID=3365531 RepID=UPI003722B365
MRKSGVRAGHRSATALLTAVAGLALLTGCALPDHRDADAKPGGSASATPSFVPKAPVPSGKALGPDAHVTDPGGVKGTDAGAVAKAWAEMAYNYDTAYDSSPHDAVLRASRWLTERGAKAESRYRPESGPGNEWNTWAKHHAWTAVTVTSELEDDAPVDSDTVAYRSLVVEGTAHGRDGWSGTGPRLNAYVKLVRSTVGEPWRVDDVTVVEAVAPPSRDTSSAPTDSPSDTSGQ